MIDPETKQFIIEINQQTKAELKQFVTEQIAGLAEIVARGFAEVHEKMVTKREFYEFRTEVNERFDRVEAQSRSHQNQTDHITQ